jgi:hypothetical protein
MTITRERGIETLDVNALRASALRVIQIASVKTEPGGTASGQSLSQRKETDVGEQPAKDTWRVDLKRRVRRILQGEPRLAVENLLEVLSTLGATTYGFGVDSGVAGRRMMWVSRVGQRQTGMVRLRMEWDDPHHGANVSLPIPDSIDPENPRLEFIGATRDRHPIRISPAWACEIGWFQVLQTEIGSALLGMSDNEQARILSDPLTAAFQVRWDSEFAQLAGAKSDIALAKRRLWNEVSGKLSKVDCEPSRAFEAPRAHRSCFLRIMAAGAGRRLELISTAQQLEDTASRYR